MVVSHRIALRWDPVYARCVGCGTRDPDRPHLAEGLCLNCFADEYGALGMDDVPPEWADREEDTMTAMEQAFGAAEQAQAFACLGWWDKANGHHKCADPRPLMRAKGRCASCYNAEHRARGGVRTSEEAADLLARQGLAPLPAPISLHTQWGNELPSAEDAPEPEPVPVVPAPEPAPVVAEAVAEEPQDGAAPAVALGETEAPQTTPAPAARTERQPTLPEDLPYSVKALLAHLDPIGADKPLRVYVHDQDGGIALVVGVELRRRKADNGGIVEDAYLVTRRIGRR